MKHNGLFSVEQNYALNLKLPNLPVTYRIAQKKTDRFFICPFYIFVSSKFLIS